MVAALIMERGYKATARPRQANDDGAADIEGYSILSSEDAP